MQIKNHAFASIAGTHTQNDGRVRIQLMSDLHLDTYTGPYAGSARILRHPDADLVVVAGDIGDGPSRLGQLRKMLGAGPIVMVAGNHDVMGLWWHSSIEVLKAEAEKHDIVLLENEEWQFKGIRFLGCTLWTDFEIYGLHNFAELTRRVPECLPEYGAIAVANAAAPDFSSPGGARLLRPSDVIDRHHASRAWLHEKLQTMDDQATVVLTHHLPHKKSVHPQYHGAASTGGFASNCEELFYQPCNPVYWFHGHTHHCVEYLEYRTTVVCRPMGYPRMNSAKGLTENLAFDALGPLLCVPRCSAPSLP